MLLILMAFLTDTCLGDCVMLLLSAFLYSTGLLIWFFLYPYFGATTIKIRIYLSLVLITVGQSGYVKYIGGENEERHIQDRAVVNDNDDEGRGASEILPSREDRARSRLLIYPRKIFTRLWSEIIDYKIVIVGTPVAMFLIPGGRYEYLLLAFYLISFSTVFFIGKRYYNSSRGPQTSSLVQVFRVFLAALFNKWHSDTSRTSIYYGDANNTSQSQLEISGTSRDDNHVAHVIEDECRFLDRATLYNPSTENARTEFDNHRLFTVNQVNDTRRFFKAIKLSSVFLMYGVLTSVGATFFTGQVDKMNAHINSFEVPIEIIAYSPRVTEELVSRLCRWVGKRYARGPHHPFYGAERLCLAMLLSVPCFVAAFLVEAKRLEAIKTSPNNTLSVFWLMPQLFLIGAIDGLAITSIEDFFQREMCEPISSSYGNFLAEGVMGVGQLLGCVLFVCCDSLSGWFGDDIDHSHLDRYYRVMAVFGFISFIICTSVTVICYGQNSKPPGGSSETPDNVAQSTQSNSTDIQLRASISFRGKESKLSNPRPVV